jgi:hypothetical protein
MGIRTACTIRILAVRGEKPPRNHQATLPGLHPFCLEGLPAQQGLALKAYRKEIVAQVIPRRLKEAIVAVFLRFGMMWRTYDRETSIHN